MVGPGLPDADPLTVLCHLWTVALKPYHVLCTSAITLAFHAVVFYIEQAGTTAHKFILELASQRLWCSGYTGAVYVSSGEDAHRWNEVGIALLMDTIAKWETMNSVARQRTLRDIYAHATAYCNNTKDDMSRLVAVMLRRLLEAQNFPRRARVTCRAYLRALQEW